MATLSGREQVVLSQDLKSISYQDNIHLCEDVLRASGNRAEGYLHLHGHIWAHRYTHMHTCIHVTKTKILIFKYEKLILMLSND